MKRICSLVLSGLLAVSALTGCQSGGASPSGAQPAPSQTGEEKDAVVIVMNMESEPEAGFDPAYGARPLRRQISALLEDPAADAILTGRAAPGDRLIATACGGEIVLEKE